MSLPVATCEPARAFGTLGRGTRGVIGDVPRVEGFEQPLANAASVWRDERLWHGFGPHVGSAGHDQPSTPGWYRRQPSSNLAYASRLP